MVTIRNSPVQWKNGSFVPAEKDRTGIQATMAWSILQAHNISGSPDRLQIRFDAMASHDITYVGIIQTAREQLDLQPGDRVYIPGIRALLEGGGDSVEAKIFRDGGEAAVTLTLPGLTREERDIILAGCLINYYAQ